MHNATRAKTTKKVRAGGAKEVAKNDMDIVSALRDALADKVGKERFELWFGATTRFEIEDGTVTVVVADRFLQDWLRSKFSRTIQEAIEQTLGRRARLGYRIEEPGSHEAAEPAANGNRKPDRPGAPPAPEPPGTLPFGQARRRPLAELESFVTGDSNRLARAAADSVVCRPGEVSPLLIHGPTSVGKTHLLEGICGALRERHRRAAVVCLSAEQFTTDFVQAIRGGGLPSFRRKYRGVDALIVDDFHFFCGKRSTQIEFLYTLETLLRERRQVVLAADRPLPEMGDLPPELLTRLTAGMVCRIEPPEYETRRQIVAQMAGRLGLRLPDEVERYVASNLTAHARELSGAVCRLHAAGQATGRPITLAVAEDALSEMIRSGSRPVRLADIEKAVCETFDLAPKALHSDRRAGSVSHPRMLAMWLARKYTRSALSEISTYFGRRSHTTVLSAQKRVDAWLANGKTVQLADHTWKISDAVEQVERQLKIG